MAELEKSIQVIAKSFDGARVGTPVTRAEAMDITRKNMADIEALRSAAVENEACIGEGAQNGQ